MKNLRITALALLLALQALPALAQSPSSSFRRHVVAGTTDPVWMTAHGKKFHRASCRMIQGPHDVVHRISRASALRHGYEPCKICKP